MKVCPRTGMIIKGPARPHRPPQSPHMMRPKKSGNAYPAKPLPQGSVPPEPLPQVQGLTLKQLQQLAVQIGQTIANQIAGQLQAYPAVQSQANDVPKVSIDESIIDVGIGEEEPLEKGAGSGKIVKEETVKDDISAAKQRLKALKAG